MSTTRVYDDKCAIDQKTGLNSGILGYVMDPSRNTPQNSCMPEFGIFTSTTRKMPVSQMVDAESKMFGLDKKLSKCSNNTPPCSFPNTKGLYCDGKTDNNFLGTCEFIKYPARPNHLGHRL